VDGNFHADHIKMRRPDMDIMLTNGQGYMVEAVHYEEYMNVVKQPPLVSLNIPSFDILTYLTRGQHVEITELSMMPTLTIGAIWMLLVLLPVVVPDMDVSSQLQSVICKKVNGEWL
jgi:hypothetical protein